MKGEKEVNVLLLPSSYPPYLIQRSHTILLILPCICEWQNLLSVGLQRSTPLAATLINLFNYSRLDIKNKRSISTFKHQKRVTKTRGFELSPQ